MSPGTDTLSGRFERDIKLPEFTPIAEGFLPGNVFLDFYFTPHITAEHFSEGAKLLQCADVFIPELVGWNQKALREYNAIAKGDKRIYENLGRQHEGQEFGDFIRSVFSALYNSRKSVVFIDVDDTRKDLVIGDFGATYRRAITSDVEGTLDGFADAASRIAEVSHARDLIMVESLDPEITKLVTNHPRLSTQERVSVLVSLGVSHLSVYEAINGSPYAADRITARHWAGITSFHAEGKIVDKYKSGSAPTYEDMAEFLVKSALSMVQMPNIYEHSFYDVNSVYKRKREIKDDIGEEIAKIIFDMGDEGLELCRRIVRRAKLKISEAELLRDTYTQALEVVNS